MAKKDGPKIPREDWTYGHATELTDHLTITYDSRTDQVHIPELDPTTFRRVTSYQKANGKDKPLYSAPSPSFSLSSNCRIEQLREQFDYLLAVDTNTMSKPERIRGVRISACASFAIAEPIATAPSHVSLHPVAVHVILDPGPVVNAELLGWHLIIRQLQAVPALASKRIGIIVDSELGLHVEFNARRKPYYADHILPRNMQLIYAGDDTPETFANLMIKQCDRTASALVDDFKARDPNLMDSYRGDRYGTAICVKVAIPAPHAT